MNIFISCREYKHLRRHKRAAGAGGERLPGIHPCGGSSSAARGRERSATAGWSPSPEEPVGDAPRASVGAGTISNSSALALDCACERVWGTYPWYPHLPGHRAGSAPLTAHLQGQTSALKHQRVGVQAAKPAFRARTEVKAAWLFLCLVIKVESSVVAPNTRLFPCSGTTSRTAWHRGAQEALGNASITNISISIF